MSRRPMAARPLRRSWLRWDWPTIEWWTGRLDAVWGPNFVVPPTAVPPRLVTVHDLTCVRFPAMVTPDVAQYPALLRRAAGTRRPRPRRVGVHPRPRWSSSSDFAKTGSTWCRTASTSATSPAATRHAVGRSPGAERYVLSVATLEPRKDLTGLVARVRPRHGRRRPDLASCWQVPTAGAQHRSTRPSPTPRTATASCGPDSSTTPPAATSSPAPSSSPTRAATRGSGSRRSRRWPPAWRWSPPPWVRSPRSAATPPSSSRRLTPEALAGALVAVTTDDETRAALVERGRARAAMYSWSRSRVRLPTGARCGRSLRE